MANLCLCNASLLIPGVLSLTFHQALSTCILHFLIQNCICSNSVLVALIQFSKSHDVLDKQLPTPYSGDSDSIDLRWDMEIGIFSTFPKWFLCSSKFGSTVLTEFIVFFPVLPFLVVFVNGTNLSYWRNKTTWNLGVTYNCFSLLPSYYSGFTWVFLNFIHFYTCHCHPYLPSPSFQRCSVI